MTATVRFRQQTKKNRQKGGADGAGVTGQVKLHPPGGVGSTTKPDDKPSDRDVGATGLRTLLSF